MVFNAQRDAYNMWGNMENLYWDSSFTTLEGMLILNCPTEKVARVIKLQLKESALIRGVFCFRVAGKRLEYAVRHAANGKYRDLLW